MKLTLGLLECSQSACVDAHLTKRMRLRSQILRLSMCWGRDGVVRAVQAYQLIKLAIQAACVLR